VVLAGEVVGVAHPDIASFVATRLPAQLTDYQLVFDDHADVAARSAMLAEVSLALREAGFLPGWRGELLDVRPLGVPYGQGDALAAIERASCRALGITTHAIHLNAFTADGRLVLARRSLNKAVDPGLWDNLVGGMVASGETEQQALLRESFEEAGLDAACLPMQRGALLHEGRRVADGFMRETVQVFDTVLPEGTVPVNQDGEVAAIETWTVGQTLDAIEQDGLTVEAALVTLDGIRRSLSRTADKQH
jgi:8-oxo-dGTP pyrophosphatase MutT (NUDIX family)